MKKLLLLFLLISTASYSQDNNKTKLYSDDNSFSTYSEANAYSFKDKNGKSYIIFVFSEPKHNYRVIGRVKSAFFSKERFNGQLENIVKQVQQKYPTAEAIILKNDQDGFFSAEVIEFGKEKTNKVR